MDRYTVTIHVAAPGTPLNQSQMTSVSGHMYLSLQRNGEEPESFGFQPIKETEKNGERINAEVTDTDLKTYLNPRYSRTLEITKEQYDAITEFAKNPRDHGFDDRRYSMFSNSCIDFTWNALQHAGIHAKIPGTSWQLPKFYDGELKVLQNIPYLRSIEPPLPDSKLNTETIQPLPKRNNALEHLLTQAENGTLTPAQAMAYHPLLGQSLQGVHALDASLNRAPDAGSARMAASLAAAARENGMERVDAVFLSERRNGGDTIVGEQVFARQGPTNHPAALRVALPTAQALATPMTDSLAALDVAERQVAMQSAQIHSAAKTDPGALRA